jgi:hypothetical protein
MPCRDKTEWQKLNGTPIHPPFYVKKVGRPTKSRRNQPYEVAVRGGGKKITRHGIIIHCGYCKEPDHNKKGCKHLKVGLPPPNAPVIPQPEEPVIPQVCLFLLYAILSFCCTLFSILSSSYVDL